MPVAIGDRAFRFLDMLGAQAVQRLERPFALVESAQRHGDQHARMPGLAAVFAIPVAMAFRLARLLHLVETVERAHVGAHQRADDGTERPRRQGGGRADAGPDGSPDRHAFHHAHRRLSGAGRNVAVAAERMQIVLARLVDKEGADAAIGKARLVQGGARGVDLFLQLKMTCNDA